MEYLKVLVPGREGQDIDVLINSEKNGKVGEVLLLGKGYIIVSVDISGSEEKQINLADTTPKKPMIVEVRA